MSLNIQTADGLLEIGGKVTKEKVISALGYKPADEDDLPNITEDESGELSIADESGNVILKVDADGVHTTEVTAKGVMLGETVLNHIDNSSAHITENERNAWNNKSDFSGVYDDLVNAPNILENGSGQLDIADESGNIVLKVDKDGLKTTTVIAGQVVVDGKDVLTTIDSHVADKTVHVTKTEKETWNNKSDFSGAYEDLEGKPDIMNDESGSMIVADESGNIIMQVDSNGLETTTVTAKKLVADGKDILSTIDNHISDDIAHVTKKERETWNNKSDFSGNYNDLIDAPNISDDDTGVLNIADESGNVILKVDKDGLETTAVTTNEVILNGTNVEVELKGLGDKFDNLDSDLDSHTSDTNIHITVDERNIWNAKATTDYVDQKVAGVVNSAPETLDTLNELATALGNDENFATTVTNAIAEKASKEELNTHANNIDIHIIDSERDKWDKNIEDLDTHVNDDIRHITSDERNTWNNKSDFSGNYNDLVDAPDISDNDETGEFIVSDKSGNIILRVDKDGLETTDVVAQKVEVNGEDIESKLSEFDSHVSDVTDFENVVVSTYPHVKDSDRLSWNAKATTKYVDDKIDVLADTKANKTDLHEHSNKTILDTIDSNKIEEWNNKSDFSGNYNDLIDAPDIIDDTTGELNVADELGNVILRINSNGLETTNIAAKTIAVNGTDIGDFINALLNIDYQQLLQFDTDEIVTV